jgi:hypothetical protein
VHNTIFQNLPLDPVIAPPEGHSEAPPMAWILGCKGHGF